MQRVMIIGQPVRKVRWLSDGHTGLPVIHIDTIHWQPGWVERNTDEKTFAFVTRPRLAISGILKGAIRPPGMINCIARADL